MNIIIDKSRLSATENFPPVLPSLEMLQGLLETVLTCHQFCSHHRQDKTVLPCACRWCELGIRRARIFLATRDRNNYMSAMPYDLKSFKHLFCQVVVRRVLLLVQRVGLVVVCISCKGTVVLCETVCFKCFVKRA